MQKKTTKTIEMVRGSDGVYREGKTKIVAKPATLHHPRKFASTRQPQGLMVNQIVQELEEIGEVALQTLFASLRIFR